MNKRIYFLAVILIAVPFIYLAYVWPSLPQTVPLHFGIDGKPDGFGSKNELITMMVITAAISIGVSLLLLNIHKIDPKKPKNSPVVMAKIACALLIFITLLQLMIVQSAVTSSIQFDKLFLPLLGGLFAFLGNLFYSVKPNYFVGIRTPWALEDEDNWRRTHQMAGKLWFGAGLLTILLSFILRFEIAMITFTGITVVICIIPFIYSYRIFKQSKPIA